MKVLVGALVATSAVGVSAPASNAATPVGTTNSSVSAALHTNLAIANLIAETGTATLMFGNAATQSARSVGLISKSTGVTTGQSAVVLPGAVLSLYTFISTATSFTATGGTFSASAVGLSTVSGTFSAGSTAIAFALATPGATPVAHSAAALWTAPTTAGSYTITARSSLTDGSLQSSPTRDLPLLGVSFADISVTVRAATHSAVGGTNVNATEGTVNNNMFVAVAANEGVTGIVHPDGNLGIGEASALSKGLLSKNTNVTTAQTATVLVGAVLSLYSYVSTHAAYTATSGKFSGSLPSATAAYSEDLKTSWIPGATSSARKTISTLWTAPTTAGTYTVSMYTGYPTNSAGLMVEPTASAGLLPVTLGASLVVTVVAASAGSTYSAVYSVCTTDTDSTFINASGLDAISSSDVVTNGNQWFANFALRDAYNAVLGSGNLVATATNGALINIGTSGATPAAGTSSTDVEFAAGSANTIRIDQPTAGAPLTTTVTLTYNGTTVCTKTVTIRGTVSKITVANVGTQDLSGTTGGSQWMYQSVGAYTPGQFTILATDSAGNIVATPTTHGTYGAVAATLTTTVPAMSFPTLGSDVSSSAVARFTYGHFTCGAAAGSSSVQVQYTIAATGTIIKSDAFTARCADDRYSYTASLDKAAYNQGDIATLTVKFLDSKGNAANNYSAPGTNRIILPFMNGVDIASDLGVNAASSTAVTKADGTVSFTLTVGGGASGVAVTAGTYTGIVEFDSATIVSAKSTPTYKLSTGGDTTSFTDVLKSVVALIASINKQIQALQKLILKR